jgi:hypothetical protein
MFERLSVITNSSQFIHVKRHWLTFAFLLGFVIDNLTLNRVDQLFDNVLLFSYVLIAMLSMVYLYAGVAGRLPETWIPYSRIYAPLLTQYAFGGLLSGMLIFYGRSGTWAESWPFLVLILLVIYGNETIRDRASRLVFNLSMFFVGLFSYVVLVIPVATGYMGPWIFLASGVLALVIMRLFLLCLHFIIPNFLELQMKTVVFTIGCIFAGLNFLYFTNIIPPIPLSLKEVGIYHSVVRFEDNSYQLKYEDPPWWQFWRRSDKTFHPTPDNNIFCFARVFAPARISTDIYHSWDYYDAEKEKWVEYARLSYVISGGRDEGYRGYTLVENYRDGKWRCSVETKRGQVLGREDFIVDSSQPAGQLVTRTE